MIIKKWNSTSSQWEEQYPKTLETMIYDSNDGTTALFANRKIKPEYLPDTVFGGMTFVGTVGYSTNATDTLEKLIQGGSTNWTISSSLDSYTGLSYSGGDYAGIGQRYVGYYWVVQNNVTLTVSDSAGGAADFAASATDDGIDQSTSAPYAIGVEHGDWIIITGWDNGNSKFLVSVINNTYTAATTSISGVVELATDAEVTTGTSTSLIPSVKQLKDNYAAKIHSHDDDEINASKTYTFLQNGIGDSLDQVLDLVDAALSTNTTNISTNASDITNLEARKEVFVQASAPTANQNNDIWFDI